MISKRNKTNNSIDDRMKLVTLLVFKIDRHIYIYLNQPNCSYIKQNKNHHHKITMTIIIMMTMMMNMNMKTTYNLVWFARLQYDTTKR